MDKVIRSIYIVEFCKMFHWKRVASQCGIKSTKNINICIDYIVVNKMYSADDLTYKFINKYRNF